MWRHYLSHTIRLLERHKLYSFINIVGLAIGLAACLIVLIYVRHETRYDLGLANAERLFQVQTHYVDEDPAEARSLQTSAYAMREFLLKDFPQIRNIQFVLPAPSVLMHEGNPSSVEDMKFVDGPFFDMFHYPFLHGDPASALREPGSLVLTVSEALRRFGRTELIGRTVQLITNGQSRDYRVTGVIRDIPENSHFRLSMLARFDPRTFFADQPDFFANWWWQSGWMYVQLREAADAERINASFPAWERRNIPSETSGGSSYNPGDDADFELVNVRDIHLGRAQLGAMTPGNDRTSLLALLALSFAILTIACFNFINLSTALGIRRAREVGLRKVVGATRRQLVTQFLAESLLLSLIALLVALSLVELGLHFWSRLMGVDLAIDWNGDWETLAMIGGLLLFVGLVGGAYPALHLARIAPARALRTNEVVLPRGGSLRVLLVAAQFAVTIGLIVCTFVILSQTIYARDIDPGFARAHLLQVDNLAHPAVASSGETFAREVEKIPQVVAAARSTMAVASTYHRNTRVRPPAGGAPVTMASHAVDAGYFDAMAIDLLGGRGFSAANPADEARLVPGDAAAERALVERGIRIIVNETAARQLGFGRPSGAVGQQVQAALAEEENGGMVPATIIGVVQDSRFNTVREPVRPAIFRMDPGAARHLVVRFRPGTEHQVRRQMARVWRGLFAEVPFEADLADDLVHDLYESEELRGRLFGIAALLAVSLGCLGLFGLAAFTAERRTKEIGIRKVFGADTMDIVRLLAWHFSKPVIAANLVAWPVAWWLMRDWLNNFDARIDLGPAPFLFAGLLAWAIAVGTVSGHAFRVARSSPILALRHE